MVEGPRRRRGTATSTYGCKQWCSRHKTCVAHDKQHNGEIHNKNGKHDKPSLPSGILPVLAPSTGIRLRRELLWMM